jgi:hypothetical protein
LSSSVIISPASYVSLIPT